MRRSNVLAALPVESPRHGQAKPVRQLRLLLLDDDLFVSGAQSLMLRSLGYGDIVTAASAESALASLAAAPVDVVVCDLGMPGTDGIGFLRALAATPAPPSVILLFSGHGSRILQAVLRLLEGGPLHVPADELVRWWTRWQTPIAARLAV